MPKRRRLLTPIKKAKLNVNKQDASKLVSDKEVSTPRGRLKGALLDALEPVADESDTSADQSPVKKERKDYTSEEEDKYNRPSSPPRQSYVLKLFDRSVDLSQFSEDSPLYPICRAWIINQPKANYKDLGHKRRKSELRLEHVVESVELPGPEGEPVTRIPSLTPEQSLRSKDNINLNYQREAPPPSREELLEWHGARWAAVRAAWLRQGARVEARYRHSQRMLDKINLNFFFGYLLHVSNHFEVLIQALPHDAACSELLATAEQLKLGLRVGSKNLERVQNMYGVTENKIAV